MQHNSENFREQVSGCLDINALDALVKSVISLGSKVTGGRTGGFFTFYDDISKSMAVQLIGEVPEKKVAQYLRNSTEKATRVFKFNQLRSFQSRDEGLEHWGGGVYLNSRACSFSGFPEKLDEAISLIYSIYTSNRILTESEFRDLISTNSIYFPDNEYIAPVSDHFIEHYWLVISS